MGRIRRTIELARSSAEVLKADKELLALPVMSTVASLIAIATFVVPLFFLGDGPSGDEGIGFYLVNLILYAILSFITIFFNTALVHAANERLTGGDPTIGSALAGAAKHLPQIIPWALVSATVSLILRSLEERGGVFGSIASSIAGVAWQVVTFLVIPVYVIEGVGVVDAVKRSGQLFKRTWGENLAAQVGFGLISFLLIIPAIAIVVLAVVSGSGAVIAIGITLAFVYGAIVTIVMSALNVVFQTALYHHAAQDGVPGGYFGDGQLHAAFAPR